MSNMGDGDIGDLKIRKKKVEIVNQNYQDQYLEVVTNTFRLQYSSPTSMSPKYNFSRCWQEKNYFRSMVTLPSKKPD